MMLFGAAVQLGRSSGDPNLNENLAGKGFVAGLFRGMDGVVLGELN